MIRSIELWDFECHEHTLLADFDVGLNLIYGDSDSGKTSLVRAVKLAAYNIFDPRSVRVGAKNCKVRIETERGYVLVTRGEDNKWETCRKGESPKNFTKIGTSILPDAADIIGLHMIELGDLSLSANVMDQTESHFMLNELGGKNASGSTRAQIVDEISGLSGIEGLIKEVGLDRHRFSRSMKEHEDKSKEYRASMHDEGELLTEENLLTLASELVATHKEANEFIDKLADLFQEHERIKTEANDFEAELNALPNTKIVTAVLKIAEEVIGKQKSMQAVYSGHAKAKDSYDRSLSALSSMPETGRASRYMAEADDAIKRLIKARNCRRDYEEELAKLKRLEERLEQCEVEELDALKERNAAMADIKVCPLTQAPISGGCLSSMKFPVLEKK